MKDRAALEALATDLRRARRVLVITGAGISADSGLPTYRGTGGLYDSGPTAEGVAIEDALSGTMLRRNPALCWKYLGEIERASRGREPNAGHRALAALAPRYERFTVLTQNVDGFHRRAGQGDLIEIHGDLHGLHCTACAYEAEVADYADLSLPPACPDCGALVRPRVVLFGEALPQAAITRLEAALREGPELVLSVGTSSAFPYISQPVWLAARAGLPTAEINPGESEVSGFVRHRIRMGAAAALSELAALLQESA